MAKSPPLRIASKRNHWSPKITRAFSTSSVITGNARRELRFPLFLPKADVRADVPRGRLGAKSRFPNPALDALWPAAVQCRSRRAHRLQGAVSALPHTNQQES